MLTLHKEAVDELLGVGAFDKLIRNFSCHMVPGRKALLRLSKQRFMRYGIQGTIEETAALHGVSPATIYKWNSEREAQFRASRRAS